jgi:hypothetical protein
LNRTTALALALLLASTVRDGRAQEFAQGWQDPRIISAAGLGPRYSGLVGAGVGLLSKKPNFGITAGEFILQPRFFLESEFTSNFFRADQRNGEPEDAMTLHVRPGLAVFNPDYDDVALSMGLDLDVFVPFGSEAVSDKTNLGGRAQVAAAFFPRSTFTLTLNESFERTLWMRPQVASNANRNRNSIGADVSFHPGGKALDFTLGYAYDAVRFDDLDRLDTDEHNLRFLSSWRFYPMTYAFLESTLSFAGYTDSRASDADAIGNLVPAMPLKVYGGLSGYFTERISVLARIGYGNSYLERGENFESVIGMAQLSWRFGPRTILHVGFARDFELAALGGYSTFMRPYATFTLRFGELADMNFDIAYDIRSYGAWEPTAVEVESGTTTPVVSDRNRSEGVLRAGLVFDFDISRLLGVTAGYRLESLISDYAITTLGQTNFTAYDDHRIFVSLNLRY